MVFCSEPVSYVVLVNEVQAGGQGGERDRESKGEE